MMFISSNSTTYAVDLRTHKTVWSYPMPGRLALSQTGVLYIQGTEALVAISLK
jgi:outer membrane protein assembly factor BamB